MFYINVQDFHNVTMKHLLTCNYILCNITNSIKNTSLCLKIDIILIRSNTSSVVH